MSTLSHQLPSLEQRILASSLIVVAAVEDGPTSFADYATDPPQVHSVFQVVIEHTLRGRGEPGTPLTVRVLGGQVAELHTEWRSELRPGERVLLFLTPYLAADREPDEPEMWVPYFRGAYRVSGNDVVDLPTESLPLADLPARIASALQRQDQQQAAQPEHNRESADPQRARDSATPHTEPGGARWRAVED